jgi:PPOX class probable F420-dependent enzyme
MSAHQYPEWMGKMRGLTGAEIEAFLAGPIVARVATVAENGAPYITPVWQEYDGESLWFIPREKTVLVRHLRREPRVAISCALDQSPYTRVLFQGRAEIVAGPAVMEGQMLQIAERMALRYLGERGPDYLAPTHDRPRYLVRVQPEQITSWEGVEWHPKYL